ncbi:LamG domain-containing protein [Aeromonas veronii]|uniref:LamG domain-containing protein n=2 Tax=Aeromonas veronii TaxID=654 RepID=A0A4S5CSR2_AERVE|nr:LamG domain-containing protein [Aeromonas veronii]
MAGPKAAQNSVVFGFSPLSTNINRCMLFYHESIGLSFWQDISPPNGGTKYRSITNNWDNLSFGCHHFVIQLNAAGTGTDVYIDGVKDAGLGVPLDIFLQPAGQQLLIGAYGNKGVPDSGNCQTSDTAVYSRPLTEDEIAYRQFVRGLPIFTRIAMTAIPANQEPRSQFQPQDVAWRGTPPMCAGPVNLQQQTQYPLCKGRDYYWWRDGVRNVEQGYIESTVTINGVGVRRRVLCFTQDGELVGETYSRASDGVYRFDLLWLNKRYMLVAQDDPAFGPADYNAVAADYQAPKPYPPGGGVAPAPFPMLAPLKRK